MEPARDIISELEAVTSEMAELQDLGDERLGRLLEVRRRLIGRLIQSHFDASDIRLASIVANADLLHERLHRHCVSLREDLSGLDSTRVLMDAVRSTLAAPMLTSLDIKA